jgi:hypothetical protein
MSDEVAGSPEVEAHAMSTNTNEATVEDEPEVEAHNWGSLNVNEIAIADDTADGES